LQAGERKVYRFVMQSPSYAFEGLDGGFKATARDFKKLTIEEAGKLRPLKIKILTVREDDRVQNFVKQMKGVETPEEMFRILNGLGASEHLVSGTKVKIITDSQVF
jgi:predicted Zn-dependent protease